MADTRTLFLMALLITAAAILFTSMFPNVTYTGRTLSAYSGVDKIGSISINPVIVTNGDSVTITVKPGSLGVYKEVKFCRSNGACIARIRTLCLESYKCFKDTSFSYIIPTSFEIGSYVVKVYDYYKQDYIAVPFEIKELSGPSAPLPRISGPTYGY